MFTSIKIKDVYGNKKWYKWNTLVPFKKRIREL